MGYRLSGMGPRIKGIGFGSYRLGIFAGCFGWVGLLLVSTWEKQILATWGGSLLGGGVIIRGTGSIVLS